MQKKVNHPTMNFSATVSLTKSQALDNWVFFFFFFFFFFFLHFHPFKDPYNMFMELFYL